MGTQSTVVLEVTVWDADKIAALIRKIEGDPRVIRVQELA